MTLFRYILLRFLATFGRVLLIFAFLLFVVGIVDELGALKPEQGITRAIYMSVIGQMQTAYTILPLMMIIAAITFFLSLSRSSELVAVRASGVSGLRFLLAPCTGALLVGLVAVAMFNPLVAVFSTKYEAEKGRANASTALSVGDTGVWLRQSNAGEQTMVHAKTTEQSGLRLLGATFISFDANGTPIARVEAVSAQLEPQAWVLKGALSWDLTQGNPESLRKALPDGSRIATNLDPEDLTSGFGRPNSVQIWALPAHIASLQSAGFSARAFQVWLQSELAKPLFLVVMVMVAAGFTMRHIRSGNRAQLVIIAVMLGFGIFFFRNIAEVFGQNGKVPVMLSAWGPTAAASLLAVSLLLHLEEG
jgi:lipopolysaccharide export system permease protein